MKKYNRRQIMKNAWALVKTERISISTALKAAWALEKAMINAEAVCADCEANYCGHSKVSVNDWRKYGKSRTYISVRVYTNAWNLKREVKLGYIDNMTGAYIAA